MYLDRFSVSHPRLFMGLHRINSDLTLPNSNWKRILCATSTDTNPFKIAVVGTLAQRALLKADPANTNGILIGPSTTPDYTTLAPGDEMEISAQMGSTFDVGGWYQIITHNGDLLHLIIQP